MNTLGIITFCLVVSALQTSAADSCVGRCNTGLDTSKTCQCNSACETYGDCCTDYQAECLGAQYSCSSRCGESYNSANPCHCNDLCEQYGNCCTDYDSYCSGITYSCQSRCGEAYDASNPCHCNDRCQEFGNCCDDYSNYCTTAPDPTQAPADSCSGRCNDGYDPTQACQCNSACSNYGNCCSDYDSFCGGSGGNPGNDLSTLAQALWDADVNRIEGSDLIFNQQAYLTNYQARNDLSSEPLFTYVNPAKLDTGTWPTFRALLDNYNLFTGTTDTNTVAENQEIENFLDEVFSTEVMSLTYQFMVDNGYFSSLAAFRAYVKDTWFTLYTRSGGVLDSSAFEHTFVGEVKNGKVSGYHNWLAFYEDEQENKVNYYGFTSDNEPNQILMQFRMDVDGGSSYYKELASIIYGASPEFELAIFTACFKENPNALSTFTMNGYTQKVQTWDYTGGYIGSAYFSV